MKILKIILTLIFCITMNSCNDDDSVVSEKEYLIGTWKVVKTKTYNYVNDELNNVEERSFDKEPYSKLNLDSNGKVSYENSELKKPIQGNWTLKDMILSTDLKLDLTSTGFGVRYFFPVNEITQITNQVLILKSKSSIETTNLEGDKFKYYTETYLEK